MTVVQQPAVDRTFLDAVNRVLERVGSARVSTLSNATRRVQIAMECVQDARDRVYYRTMWDFRKGFLRIDLVEGEMWYVLPDDYHKMASDLSKDTEGERGLNFITYDQLISNFPDLRSFPPGAGVSNISTVSALAQQTHSIGTPMYYTTESGYIGIYPRPNAEFVADEGSLYGRYWKQAGVLQADNDSLLLPQNLWYCAHFLALGQTKKALEMVDWEADYRIGSSELRKESAGSKESEDMTVYDTPTINYNE